MSEASGKQTRCSRGLQDKGSQWLGDEFWVGHWQRELALRFQYAAPQAMTKLGPAGGPTSYLRPVLSSRGNLSCDFLRRTGRVPFHFRILCPVLRNLVRISCWFSCSSISCSQLLLEEAGSMPLSTLLALDCFSLGVLLSQGWLVQAHSLKEGKLGLCLHHVAK